MKLLVCGGRNYKNEAFMWRKLDELHAEHKFTEFMQGGASGADRIAKAWATTKPEIARYECKANWSKYGSAAGPIRNSKMLEWKPDLVVAFPDPVSTGTWDMVGKAAHAGVKFIVFE